MGTQLNIGMRGALSLSLDGVDTGRPLQVAIEDITLDLDALMEQGGIQAMKDSSKLSIVLKGVQLTLIIDADEVLSRAVSAIVAGFEEEMR